MLKDNNLNRLFIFYCKEFLFTSHNHSHAYIAAILVFTISTPEIVTHNIIGNVQRLEIAESGGALIYISDICVVISSISDEHACFEGDPFLSVAVAFTRHTINNLCTLPKWNNNNNSIYLYFQYYQFAFSITYLTMIPIPIV